MGERMISDRIVRFDVQTRLVNKTKVLVSLVAALASVEPLGVFAGTIKNHDKRNYRIEVTLKNHVKKIIP